METSQKELPLNRGGVSGAFEGNQDGLEGGLKPLLLDLHSS